MFRSVCLRASALSKSVHLERRTDKAVLLLPLFGAQVLMHKFLESADVRTLDPSEADYFFVPAYPKCVSDREKKTDDQLNKLYTQ
eukprot:1277362-Pyramimonas_sp.AAC.1